MMKFRFPVAVLTVTMLAATALAAVLFAVAAIDAPALHAQTFTVEDYRQHLQQTNDISGDELEALYPAGMFQSGVAGTGFANVQFADSIDGRFELTGYEKELIDRHGFMVTERLSHESFGSALSSVYCNDLPVFVSTDAILHALHMSYDVILKRAETGLLIGRLDSALRAMHLELPKLAQRYADQPGMNQPLADLDVYLSVARRLLLKSPAAVHFPGNNQVVNELIEKIDAEQMEAWPLFGERPRRIDFSQFKPRGHYTDSKELEAYFRAMIWLGRTELYLIAPESDDQGPSEADVQRQTILTMLMAEAVESTSAARQLDEFDAVIASFVGESDNVTLDNLATLRQEANITAASDLLDIDRFRSFQQTLREKSYAFQRINSQILMSDPFNTDQIVPASAFMLMGQRFVIDSYVTGEVVYDKILYKGQKMRRMLPSTLDVLFALGNDATAQLLEPELEQYHYADHLAALRYLIDSYDEEFWNASMYNGWLNSIRALNPPADRSTLPEFMRTAAWWQQKMNTQLASWAELRHDNLLYAKQSYSGGVGCSFPYSYVEPIPEFYRAVSAFARHSIDKFDALGLDRESGLGNVIGYFDNLANVCDTLQGIAVSELEGVELDSDQRLFLERMISWVPAGCTQNFGGWYTSLYITGDEGIREPDYLVADVHTAPTDAHGNMVGWVVHAGTGKINMAVVVATMPDGREMAFAGPVMSYHEHVTDGFTRLTDEEWAPMLQNGEPQRPALVNLYLAGPDGGPRGEIVSLSVNDASSVDRPEATAGAAISMRSYPNPSARAATIEFTIPPSIAGSGVSLDVYDATGRHIRSLVEEKLPSNTYYVRWDLTDASSRPVGDGVYLYRITIGDVSTTGKMVVERQ